VVTRRNFSLVAGIGLLSARRAGHAQPASTIRRVGALSLPSEATNAPMLAAFMQAMRNLGWVEGKNIEYRFTYADGVEDRLDSKMRELIAQKVEVILAPSPPATRAAQRATKTIPIVMASVSNAVANGFIASLAKPEGNITGITNQQEEVLGKLIEILHEVTPGVRRIAILLNENSLAYAYYWTAARDACATLNMVAIRIVANTPAQLSAAVEQIVRERSQAVVVVRDGMYLNERAKLQVLMRTTRLPVAYGFREHVADGGLLSYASDVAGNYRDAAKYVDKILKGAKPADLPVERPTKFELVINLKTARALGITLPQTVLLRADEVIE
jgi:putative ABC transport system substrate-binding protein